jgi:[LSU ribosomal protein L3P]-glutamine N5-methyltransferase (EC 2.1.1.-)
MSSNSAVDAEAPAELASLRDFVRWGASLFGEAGLVFGHGSDNALDEAFHLVAWGLHLPFDLPDGYLDARLTADERRRVAALLRRRARERRPAAYLTGEAWFAGLPFTVNEHVLVPRSPIAELVSARFRPWLSVDPRRILDLCTGSGCIGIACAYAFPEAEVVLAEIDAEAAVVAEANIARHGLADRVRVARGDLFEAVRGERFDLVVSNPPYVPTAEWQALAAEYRHEPRLALDGGDDGMDLVERLLVGAPEHLEDDGLLVCEIGGSGPEFEARFDDLPVTWPSFEHGGDGVFVIDRGPLEDWQRQRGTFQRRPADVR